MTQKKFLGWAGGIFLVVALLHGLRLVFRWEAVIAGWQVPPWVSGVALVVAGWLAAAAFKLRSGAK